MADYILTATPALGGYDQRFGDTHLREVPDLAVVSIALPLGSDEPAISAGFGIALPAVGHSTMTGDGAMRLARLGRDQLFVLFSHTTPDAKTVIAAKLKGQAYTTDQTDVWVGLEISGAPARAALERICPIDLHPDAFNIDDVARTVMEHLGALILRTGADRFLLLSARSSAGSFLHSVEVSIRNVIR